ncbi:hypothetical protein EYZ11_006699 [Aspergillus tanneri]|uniref:t-SNARE coiled-coil homology domain-containing protein n=1 Tax=Aspergillus tanneri TaxID=1220188 RepID=A0A4S3JF55_9EURO|nr:uncharacterized protein ATNIH1004_000699 [Aspergillus tanneri]KAA8651803.1 hypothetical protein ATNIH1004_000699 [Aspergillus tanneri]THC93810.1 hypothetical protein EYZ11_006699 [Aspergillus tanneri]
MTITTYPSLSPSSDSDLAVLSLSRLFARLEHNLISSAADLSSLRQSEYQRLRVGANLEYARTHLQSLERSIPHLKPLDRRHDLQTELSRNRQTLKRLQNILEEINAEADVRATVHPLQQETDDYDDVESLSLDGEGLLGTPAESSTGEERREEGREEEDVEEGRAGLNVSSIAPMLTNTSPPSTTGPESTAPSPPATLRNRHTGTDRESTATATATAIATGSEHMSSPSGSKVRETEQTLSTHRAEQEDLTSSLLSLASQLKSSSQAFQASLESEKSVLARAVDGLDRTTANMEAAERRMGMLRRMTEGKGWWGRMILFTWILGLWLVAVLIVFLGPKLRF